VEGALVHRSVAEETDDEAILAEECPLAPIYFYSRNNLRLTSVKGWHGNLLDFHPLKGVYLEAEGK
jgi:ABC-type oligopeptide transport system substrate-binding subunit